MRALVKHSPGPGNVALLDVPAPVPRDDQVLVDVAACAICGTDRSAVESGQGFDGRRVLGHEIAGVVRWVGPAADRPDLRPGDRVCVETDASLCLRCAYCRTEQYNRCPHRTGIGTTTDGGLADQLAVPGRAVHRLPDDVTLLEGALVEPLAVAVHAVVERSPALAGEVVVVTGPGAVGLLVAQVAVACGATVVLVGRSRHAVRLATARALGVQHVVDADAEDVGEVVGRLTDGYGAHSLFECSGSTAVLADGLTHLRKGGRAVLVAFYHEHPSTDLDLVVNRELEVVGSRGKRPSSFRTAIRLLGSGHVRLGPVIGAVVPLDRWEEAVERMTRGEKVVVQVAADLDAPAA
ncbi:zinc-binding dehydrogenase [Cellulosimicrobium sp. 22601]|uniref:zinc-binding dehydrogenase n=1 Tax=unclassified Cellulosimicrobium TaxID=2624466 RepID=UPI003F86DEB7